MITQILHIASFAGNFGDRLSHQGSYELLKGAYGDVRLTKVEIRDFYLNASPEETIEQFVLRSQNKYDYIVVGGGGFITPRAGYNNPSKSLVNFSDQALGVLGRRLIFISMGFEGVLNQRDYFDETLSYLIKLHDSSAKLFLRRDVGVSSIINRSSIEVYSDSSLFTDFKPSGKPSALGLVLSGSASASENTDIELKKRINYALLKRRKIKFFVHTNYDYERVGKFLKKYDKGSDRELFMVIPLSNAFFRIDIALAEFEECSEIYSERYHGVMAGVLVGASLSSSSDFPKAHAATNYYVGLKREVHLQDIQREKASIVSSLRM